LTRFRVWFLPWGSSGSEFFGWGELFLFDSCLVVSGPSLRFRFPWIIRVLVLGDLIRLLTTPSIRTVPYGTVSRYRMTFTLRQHMGLAIPFVWTHVITYRLASGKKVIVAFRVCGGGDRDRVVQSQLNRNIKATKELITG
jgi:hypothetical protein